MKTHKHLYKKVSEGVEQGENMFEPNIKMEEFVTKFKCNCGDIQVFKDTPDGEWNKSLPEKFMMKEKLQTLKKEGKDG